jgi:hypothetical protein
MLIEIEDALGKCDTRTVRKLIVDAQEFALNLQKESLEFRVTQAKLQVPDRI